jgi:hypothetical protein
MASETSNADALDAVAMELIKFSRRVVTERLRPCDEFGTEQQRVTAPEVEVTELRRVGVALTVPIRLVEAVVQPFLEDAHLVTCRSGDMPIWS